MIKKLTVKILCSGGTPIQYYLMGSLLQDPYHGTRILVPYQLC
jgi:hypothetical protein